MEPKVLNSPPGPGLICPRCQAPLADLPGVRRCSGCQGSWIPEALLHERVTAARGQRTRVTWDMEQREPLQCPTCSASMETIRVKQISLDRCPRHGIWFDAGELPHLLDLAAAQAPAPRPARSRAAVPAAIAVAAAVPATAAAAAAAAAVAETRADERAIDGVETAVDVAGVALDVVSDGGFLEGLLGAVASIFE